MHNIIANTLHTGDCLELLKSMPDDSVDLIFTSPPYEAARTYGIDFALKGEAWVAWMLERCKEMARVCKGVVCVNCEGQTRGFNYSGVPFLLMADLKRAGYALRKPLVFHRVGIPGSGGPDWFRNDWEPVICFQGKAGKLPWSENTAMGHKPKWAPGGAMSNRTTDGNRRNEWGTTPSNGYRSRERRQNGERKLNQWGAHEKGMGGERQKDGTMREAKPKPSHRLETGQDLKAGCASQPVLANPGNVLKCIVGGGVMGSPLAHENEAPFPESLPEFYIRSLCPPNGIVLDPFLGSGTVAAVAKRTGRNYIGFDVRESQIELTKRRLATVQPELIT